ncbi:ABC transporter permease [Bacillus subtilis]|nr:ABC transporter permease [Bacillus subtilis]
MDSYPKSLLTVLIPLLTMLGLVFFYESMIADPGDKAYTVAINEQLPAEMNQMIKEVKNLNLETFDDPQQAVKDGEANAYLEMPKEAGDMLQHQKPFAIKIHGYTTDDNSVITVQMLQSLLEQYQNQVVEKRLAADQIDTSVIHPFEVQSVDVEEGDEGENGVTAMLLSIASVILVIGIGGAFIEVKQINLTLSGMALAAITGVLLNLILPQPKADDDESNESNTENLLKEVQ